MHMYVYCSHNESQNKHLNFEFFIQIWKFQLFKTLFEFKIFDLNMIFSI
jgi:hypothetical protein